MEKQAGEWSKGDELSGLRRQHDELLNKLKPKQVNQSKEEGDVSLSMGAMAMDSPIDALMWRVNRIYDAIAEVFLLNTWRGLVWLRANKLKGCS